MSDLISRNKCMDTFFDLFVMEDTRIAEVSEAEIDRFCHALLATPSEKKEEEI